MKCVLERLEDAPPTKVASFKTPDMVRCSPIFLFAS